MASQSLAYLVFAAAVLSAASVQAMPGLSGRTVSATTNVVSALGGAEGQSLGYKTMALGLAGGDVTIRPQVVSATPQFGVPISQSASISVFAPPDMAYVISLPAGLRLGGGGQAIEVTGFLADLPTAGELIVGRQALNVGATLKLMSFLPPGYYTGAFDVTIQNN